MSDVFMPSAEFSEKAWIKSFEQYQEMYQRSIDDPEGFWAEVADGALVHRLVLLGAGHVGRGGQLGRGRELAGFLQNRFHLVGVGVCRAGHLWIFLQAWL